MPITKRIGTVYANAQAIGLNPFQASKLLDMESATELRKQWNYRALGFKIGDAWNALRSACSRKSRHNNRKTHFSPYCFCPRVKKYRDDRRKRDAERSINLAQLSQCDEASSIDQIAELTGGYPDDYGCRIVLGNKQLLIKRIEDVTWSDKKSRHWPESRVTYYQTTLISADGDTLASSSFNARRGDWLAEVGKSLGLPVGLKSPVTQTASMIPVSSSIHRGIEVTQLRLFGEGFEMYCAEFLGTNFHAETRHDSIQGLFRKIEAHQSNLLGDDEVITMARAKKSGLCDEGIAIFLSAIGLDGRKSPKAGEIRSAMEGVDISVWTTELRKIGLIK